MTTMTTRHLSTGDSRCDIRCAVALLLSLAGGTALAQERPGPQDSADSAVMEVINVTGTRVERQGFTTPTPTAVVTAEDINLTSATDVGQLMHQMPQFHPSKTPTSATKNNLNVGASNFDLRGLGTTRVLTLVNGRRRVANGINGALNTNVIPAGIVERVEVVTGGASAAYGSDAIAGVVNIILRDEIDGFQGSLRSGQSTHGDYQEVKATLDYGIRFADGRGRFLIATEASDNDGAGFANVSRDWARPDWGAVNNPNFAPGNGEFARLIVTDSRIGNATYGGLVTAGALSGTEFLSGGVPDPFDPGSYPLGSANTIGGDGPAESYPLAFPLERRTVYSRISYELTDDIRAFAELNYSKDIADGSAITYTLNRGSTAIAIQQDNAFLPDSLRTILADAGETSFQMARINRDFGYWGAITDNDARQLTVGLDGKFGNGWTWEAYYAHGRNLETQNEKNDVSVSRLALAVDAVLDPLTGQIVCRSALTGASNGCVPINLFGEGSPSPEAIAYVTDSYPNHIRIEQNVGEVSIQGEPFSSWAGPVSIAAGTSIRRESVAQDDDPVSRLQDHLFDNYVAQGASGTIKEIFAETVVPLLDGRMLAKQVDFNGAVRYTDHIGNPAVTWKAGIVYDVTDEWRIRATRSRDIRSPNFSELFFLPLQFFTTVTDLDGSVVAVLNPQPGNPGLKAEEADSWTAGIVYQPAWARGLRASVDYYEIKMSGRIATVSPQRVVDACGEGESFFCQFLPRDASGALTAVITPPLNTGSSLTNGVDFEVAYGFPASRIAERLGGDVTVRMLGSRAFHNNTDINGVFTEAVGDGIPNWRANASATYSTDRLSAHLGGQYVDGVEYNNSFGPFDIDVSDFPGRFYLNAALQLDVWNDHDRQVQLFATVDNLLDKDPPIIPAAVSQFGQTITRRALYDELGRVFTLGVRVRL